MKNSKELRKLTITALMMAIGMILPLLTAQIKEIGDSLLPMHFVVMLCGLVCEKWYGLALGAILPWLRSLIFGMPPLYPASVWMLFELATYGFVIGLVYSRFKKNSFFALYASLITAMISGRIVWGIAKAILLGLARKPFSFKMFIFGGFLDAIPGIVLQLVLIPVIVKAIEKTRKTS